MTDSKYNDSRPNIPADIRRSVEVESGHCCAIKGCEEHTYLEVHHIDENRENNKQDNLILLCDKHHKMAHAKVIDRKSLREYKKLLKQSYNDQIDNRFDRLEKMISENAQFENGSKVQSEKAEEVTSDLNREAPDRADIMSFVLKHVAIRHFEKVVEVPFEHQVTFSRGKDSLTLDGLVQADELDEDFILEVQYLRKSYTDAPAYAIWTENKVELYELLTGRKARGILLIVVGRERMKEEGGLPLTRQGVEDCKRKIELEVFSCTDIGFDPGPVSLGLSQLLSRKEKSSKLQSRVDVSSATEAVKLAQIEKLMGEANQAG